MAIQSQDGIEVLLEVLGLLKITEEYTSEENRTIKLATLEIEEMLTVLVPVVYDTTKQAAISKSMVPNPR